MLRCYRCAENKDQERFKPDQPYWSRWCIRCQDTPLNELPRRQTDKDKYDHHSVPSRKQEDIMR